MDRCFTAMLCDDEMRGEWQKQHNLQQLKLQQRISPSKCKGKLHAKYLNAMHTYTYKSLSVCNAGAVVHPVHTELCYALSLFVNYHIQCATISLEQHLSSVDFMCLAMLSFLKCVFGSMLFAHFTSRIQWFRLFFSLSVSMSVSFSSPCSPFYSSTFPAKNMNQVDNN